MTLPAGKYSINQVLTDLLAAFSPWWSHMPFFLWKAVLCISAWHRCIVTEASGAAKGLDLSLYLLGKEQCIPPGSHTDAGRELIFRGKLEWSHCCTPVIWARQPLFCVHSSLIAQLSLDARVQPVSDSKRNWEKVSFSLSRATHTSVSKEGASRCYFCLLTACCNKGSPTTFPRGQKSCLQV